MGLFSQHPTVSRKALETTSAECERSFVKKYH